MKNLFSYIFLIVLFVTSLLGCGLLGNDEPELVRDFKESKYVYKFSNGKELSTMTLYENAFGEIQVEENGKNSVLVHGTIPIRGEKHKISLVCYKDNQIGWKYDSLDEIGVYIDDIDVTAKKIPYYVQQYIFRKNVNKDTSVYEIIINKYMSDITGDSLRPINEDEEKAIIAYVDEMKKLMEDKGEYGLALNLMGESGLRDLAEVLKEYEKYDKKVVVNNKISNQNENLKEYGVDVDIEARSLGKGGAQNGFLAWGNSRIYVVDTKNNRIAELFPTSQEQFDVFPKNPVLVRFNIINDIHGSDDELGSWNGNNHEILMTCEYKFDNGYIIPGMIKARMGNMGEFVPLQDYRNVDIANIFLEELQDFIRVCTLQGIQIS